MEFEFIKDKDASEVPKASYIRVLSKEKEDMLYSEEFINESISLLDTYACNLARYAIMLANHAGRNTVRKEDIELAKKLYDSITSSSIIIQ